MELRIREAQFADFEAVGALTQRNGMNIEWHPSRWTFLWRDNPVSQSVPGWPIGWVLEANGAVAGYLGNVPLRYWYRGQPILAAAARGFAVDPQARSHTLKLVAAFFSQKQPDLLLNTSANPSAAAVFKLCRAQPVPYPDYDQMPFWVTRSSGFMAAFCQRFGLPGWFAQVVDGIAAPLFSVWLALRGHGPRRQQWDGECTLVAVNDIGPEFDRLWARRQEELPHAVLAERSAAMLRWHFGHEGAAQRQARVLAAHRNGELVGYLVLTREDSPALGLQRYRVADLFVGGDAPEVIDVLLRAAYETARKEGVHTVDCIGFPARVRERFMATAPLVRQLPSWQFWYRAVWPDKLPPLAQADAWYAGSFDGDASL